MTGHGHVKALFEDTKMKQPFNMIRKGDACPECEHFKSDVCNVCKWFTVSLKSEYTPKSEIQSSTNEVDK